MATSVSTDQIHPAERHAFWTEAISRSFAPIETRPLGSVTVSGHFEYVEIGAATAVAIREAQSVPITVPVSCSTSSGMKEALIYLGEIGRSGRI